VREKAGREPKRDMDPSGFAKVLEMFFGGNQEVDAAVIFDQTGETVDYHSYIDPYDARLIAAHLGILYELTRYKMDWLEKASLEMMEISCTGFQSVTLPICEDYYLLVLIKPGEMAPDVLDTIQGALEVIRKEIGC
jgi:hypothetical protein